MTWTDLSDAASGTPPTARGSHGFTSAAGKLYVHGGLDANNNPLSDLHSFDPIAMAWTDLSHAAASNPPTARSSHGFTVAGDKLYVYGGCADEFCINLLDDLHSFDPIANVWMDLSEPARGTVPTARYGHGFTVANRTLYVHGGQDENGTLLSDLHSFNPALKVWTDLSDSASGTPPTARFRHGFTSAGGKVFVHGGSSCIEDCPLGDLHFFDPVTVAWTDLSASVNGTVPTARDSHGFTSADGKLHVHGGQGPLGASEYPILGDLHAFDPITKVWTGLSAAASGIPPTARFSHGFTSVEGKLYLHGGVDANGNALGDLHAFDPVAVAWTDLSDAALGTLPTARYSHGFTSARGKLYVHGGFGLTNSGYYGGLSDLHVFDPIAMVWTDLSDPASGTPPTARGSHGFTSAVGMLYVHGSLDASNILLSDLHSFDPVAMAWTDLSTPVNGIVPIARESHGFTSADGKLYVHGGLCADYIPLGDLHSFDPVAKVWMDLSLVASGKPPAARFGQGFTSAGDKLFMHGGCDDGLPLLFCNDPFGDLHSFDPVAVVWTDLSTTIEGTPPTARYGHGFTSLIFAGARGRLYVHGGLDFSGCAYRRFVLHIRAHSI